ncbi:methyltransferase activity protein [[Candida] boidinii]|nr:methyltransferase activity protein [[Candida] boidinii]
MVGKILTSWNCEGEVHLVAGSASNITTLRINTILENGAKPVVISKESPSATFEEYIKEGKMIWKQKNFVLEDLQINGREEVGKIVDKCFVTLSDEDYELKKTIYQECLKLRIPITTTDCPELCTFTMLSTYVKGDFGLGITTSGKGCRLANRMKREIVNSIPSNIDTIIENIGTLKHKIQKEDNIEDEQLNDLIGGSEDDSMTTSKLNTLIYEFKQNKEQKKLKRARWLSQIVEYYPLSKLANISIEELSDLSSNYNNEQVNADDDDLKKRAFDSGDTNETNKLQKVSNGSAKKGSISLIGSGPGSVSLLTLGALSEILSADLVLSDKLVPQQVLDMIPTKTETFIARKFPGNAEAAQNQLLEMGLKALNEGKKVIRLKQGDPYIFGRGGEEFKFFESHGYSPLVLPGITSALASTIVSDIPATHRDVADQVLICTGTGRRGVLPNLPEYNASRTTVFLMALHRIVDLVPELINNKKWDANLPVAIVEKASSPDQRIVRTTLGNVAEVVQTIGSRPPGLLVTGWACSVLKQLPEGSKYIVEEGYQNIQHDNEIKSFLNLLK